MVISAKNSRTERESMYIGEKAQNVKLDKLLRNLRPYIDEDEAVLGISVCTNLRPTVDRFIVTERRLLAANTSDGVPKWDTPFAVLLSVESNPKKKTLTVRTAGGQDRIFRMVPAEDHRPLLKIIEEGRRMFLPEASLQPAYLRTRGPEHPPSGPIAGAATAGETARHAEHLEKLVDLRAANILTDEEFETVKTRLMG